MSEMKKMYEEAYHFNRLFKAKTYADAVEEFYGKYNDIFKKLNDKVEEKQKNLKKYLSVKKRKKEMSFVR